MAWAFRKAPGGTFSRRAFGRRAFTVQGRRVGETPSPLPTPSGRFEARKRCAPPCLRGPCASLRGGPNRCAGIARVRGARAQKALPHYEPPVREGDEREFPFIFSQHRSIANLEGRSANAPLYHKLKRLDPGDEPGDDVVKINPIDMERLGLRSGDSVRVSSPEGNRSSCAQRHGTVRFQAWL